MLSGLTDFQIETPEAYRLRLAGDPMSRVAKRKLKMSWPEIAEALDAARALCGPAVPLTIETHEAALRIAARYGYQIYDALILAAALEAGCTVLYSEDTQDGQKIDSLTVRNPFVKPS